MVLRQRAQDDAGEQGRTKPTRSFQERWFPAGIRCRSRNCSSRLGGPVVLDVIDEARLDDPFAGAQQANVVLAVAPPRGDAVIDETAAEMVKDGCGNRLSFVESDHGSVGAGLDDDVVIDVILLDR